MELSIYINNPEKTQILSSGYKNVSCVVNRIRWTVIVGIASICLCVS